MTRIGTNHFNTEQNAIRYYLAYYNNLAETQKAVREKINNQEIVIGAPDKGEFVTIDNDGRYWTVS